MYIVQRHMCQTIFGFTKCKLFVCRIYYGHVELLTHRWIDLHWLLPFLFRKLAPLAVHFGESKSLFELFRSYQPLNHKCPDGIPICVRRKRLRHEQLVSSKMKRGTCSKLLRPKALRILCRHHFYLQRRF